MFGFVHWRHTFGQACNHPPKPTCGAITRDHPHRHASTHHMQLPINIEPHREVNTTTTSDYNDTCKLSNHHFIFINSIIRNINAFISPQTSISPHNLTHMMTIPPSNPLQQIAPSHGVERKSISKNPSHQKNNKTKISKQPSLLSPYTRVYGKRRSYDITLGISTQKLIKKQ